ncbi:DUF1801 domain-containing protein [Tenacibaculum sp. MEBiC06402]|uniref:DUF1801 domain-containing protein n=1 Tax=unclassified Tenacibaculum TaxID=2635139 RepID=UPI003B9AFA66
MKPAEEFILRQEEPYKSILLQLQILIEQNFPEVELQYKWKIPFYVKDGSPFCYLNPSKKKGYVDVGFYGNNQFKKYNDVVVSEGRKVVKSLRYFSIEDINSKILIYILSEANRKKEKGFWKK